MVTAASAAGTGVLLSLLACLAATVLQRVGGEDGKLLSAGTTPTTRIAWSPPSTRCTADGVTHTPPSPSPSSAISSGEGNDNPETNLSPETGDDVPREYRGPPPRPRPPPLYIDDN